MERLAVARIGLVMMLGLCGLPAAAQSPGGWYPIERPVYQSTTVHYGGQPATYVPTITDYPTVSTRWDAPSPATVVPGPAASVSYAPPVGCEPVASYPPSVTYVPGASRYPAPTVVYMPVAARYPASPYAGYAPVAGGYPVAATSPGRKVWVHPKVYVEGQPIRNLLKAITP